MIKKIYNYLKNDIKMNKYYYIVMIVIAVILSIKLDYEVYAPGELIDLTDRIIVDNSYESNGSFNLTYVSSRKGHISNILLSYIIPSWDIVPIEDMRIENESAKEINDRNKVYLKQTSYDAIIAAFKLANIDYVIESNDVVVTHVYDLSNSDLKVGDTIKKINGNEIKSYEDIFNEIDKYNENDKIEIEVLRNNKIVNCSSVLKKEGDRLLIGINISELKNIKTTPNVKYIFNDNESGSSRGLMCALDIYNKITEFDLTKGKIIAGTGTINENGLVGPIGGVKYKLIGAVKNKAKIFIVPSENYEEANKIKNEYNYDIDLIKADTLENVVEILKNY